MRIPRRVVTTVLAAVTAAGIATAAVLAAPGEPVTARTADLARARAGRPGDPHGGERTARAPGHASAVTARTSRGHGERSGLRRPAR